MQTWSGRRVIAIIPARGGSKGIPGKNLRELAGKPLLAHSILAARAVPEVSAVYVSTDDREIAEVARAFGAEVIERPATLATDSATSESALVHALDTLSQRGEREPDAVIFLQATSPLRDTNDLPSALRTFHETDADSLFSATAAHGFMWRVGPAGPVPLNYDPVARPRRQDAPEDVVENGSFYIFKPAILRKYGSRLGGKIAVHRMPARLSFQIDEPWDFELMQWLARPAGQSPQPGPVSPAGTDYFSRREPRSTDYEEAYWGTVVDPDGVERDRTKERAQYVADQAVELAFIRSLEPGRVLDVGCGLGFMLSAIPETWERHGVEVSGFAAERARSYGTIHHGSLASAAFPDGHFDLVVINHVIEHVDDPIPFLREAIRVIAPGGRLLLGTPDFDSAMARRYGEKFRLLHDPTHVSLFTNESMFRLLRDHGLVVDRVEYPFFETRHFSKESLLRVLDTSGLSPPFYGSVMTFICTKPPTRVTWSRS